MITNPNVKINLGLNVLRKREDGFHDLETLFVPYFGISDTLEIVAGDDYSRTSAALFAKYGQQIAPSQGSLKPEGKGKKLLQFVLMPFIITDHIRATEMSKIISK